MKRAETSRAERVAEPEGKRERRRPRGFHKHRDKFFERNVRITRGSRLDYKFKRNRGTGLEPTANTPDRISDNSLILTFQRNPRGNWTIRDLLSIDLIVEIFTFYPFLTFLPRVYIYIQSRKSVDVYTYTQSSQSR